MRERQRARGPACILSLGISVPDHYVLQADYPDYYFRLTVNQHLTKLKDKFAHICEKTKIRKRHFVLTEGLLEENPMRICSHDAVCLNIRMDILMEQLPKLGARAASRAIKEWGRPKSEITHLVLCTTAAAELPGCFAGGTVLRVAKDLAENNANARVLVVCAESSTIFFRGPSERSPETLVCQALFGDGASSAIIGSDPREPAETPIFQIAAAHTNILPDCGDDIAGQLRDIGLTFHLTNRVSYLISNNIERILEDVFSQIGITDWNSIFWTAHPGGPKILDHIEAKLGLSKDKLRASRHVLGEYGNLSSCTVLFILDEIRKTSRAEKMSSTGEGFEWGVLFGFGPGITVETIVLRSIPVVYHP
ncbi:hypothetical protein SAY86_027270 [Trapa natans]|nr:hypothetical protein SAY86_027270 [Trapa natans]